MIAFGYAFADILIHSINVSYSNINTEKTNVNDVLDELIDKIDEMYLNGSEPVLKPGLIPIIVSSNGTVIYADQDRPWYSYKEKEWANAVELIQNPSKTYSVGEVIKESDIRSYFVWIPKYRYKLWNVNNDGLSTGAIHTEPFSIEIQFGDYDTKSEREGECTTPISNNQGISGDTSCQNGEWMTHPAFLTLGVTGFWVGKFEVGHKDNNTTITKTEMNPSSDAANIVVKPDYYSWTRTSAVNFFNTILQYIIVH